MNTATLLKTVDARRRAGYTPVPLTIVSAPSVLPYGGDTPPRLRFPKAKYDFGFTISTGEQTIRLVRAMCMNDGWTYGFEFGRGDVRWIREERVTALLERLTQARMQPPKLPPVDRGFALVPDGPEWRGWVAIYPPPAK